MPPRKRKAPAASSTPDGSIDVTKRSRRADADPNDHKDGKHSVVAASAAGDSAGDGGDGAPSAAADAGRSRRRPGAPTTSVITADDFVMDSDEESEVSIAVAYVGLRERQVEAPPRYTLTDLAAGAAAGAGAGAGASSAPKASSSASASLSSRPSTSSAAKAAASFYGPDHAQKVAEYELKMKENHARFAALHAATEAERETKAVKKAERKVCAW